MDIDRASFWQRRRLNTNFGGIAKVLRRLLLRFRCRAPALHEDFVASYCISVRVNENETHGVKV